MSKINRKYSKPKTIKQLLAASTISHGHIGRVVKFLISEDRQDEIQTILLEHGVAPCVARDWHHEKQRRVVLFSRNLITRERRVTSAFGRKHQYGRRIIRTEFIKGRPKWRPYSEGYDCTMEYHATKGWRSYRSPNG